MASPSLNPSTGVSAINSTTTITSGTLTTTVTGCVITAVIYSERTAASVSSVTSVTGAQSFTRQFGTSVGSGTSLMFIDVWCLRVASTFSDTIKATLNTTPGNATMHVFGVTGCPGASLVGVIDPNASIPFHNTGTTSPLTVTYSTSNPDDLIICCALNGSGSSGSSGAPALPTGFSAVANNTNAAGSGSVSTRTSQLSVSSTQSSASATFTVAATVNTVLGLVFAFTADSATTTTWLPTAGAHVIEYPFPIKLNPDEPRAQAFRFQPAISPPARWLPLTGEEDRPPNPNRIPSPDQFYPWFVRSPNPVPTIRLPTTGEEDRPPNPNRIPSPDQFFPWFVRSPNPVPTTWLPLTGEEDRPSPIKRPPDEPWTFYRSPSSFPAIWLPTAGEQDHPVPFKPFLEYTAITFQPPTAARTTPSVWWTVGQDGYVTPFKPFLEYTTLAPQPPTVVRTTPSTWFASYPDGVYVPFKPNDAQQYPWFIAPPLLNFYAQTNADDFNPLKAIQPTDITISWAPKPITTTVAISGMAWYRESVSISGFFFGQT